jgi:hypothetical protein
LSELYIVEGESAGGSANDGALVGVSLIAAFPSRLDGFDPVRPDLLKPLNTPLSPDNFRIPIMIPLPTPDVRIPILPRPIMGEKPRGILPPFIPTSVARKVCFSWPVDYVDSGYGEDVAVASGLQFIPGSHAPFVLLDQDGNTVLSGNLDAAGCTTQPPTFRPAATSSGSSVPASRMAIVSSTSSRSQRSSVSSMA